MQQRLSWTGIRFKSNRKPVSKKHRTSHQTVHLVTKLTECIHYIHVDDSDWLATVRTILMSFVSTPHYLAILLMFTLQLQQSICSNVRSIFFFAFIVCKRLFSKVWKSKTATLTLGKENTNSRGASKQTQKENKELSAATT